MMMSRKQHSFQTRDGLRLAVDVAGEQGAPPVLLLHGGGQTRGSWKAALHAIASAGFRVYSLDARGHGESGWAPDGDYSPLRMVDDLQSVIDQVGPAVVVGASMGGIVGMLTASQQNTPAIRGLVMVDVAVKLNAAGVERIQAFMRANPDGFASLDEAAEAISRFNNRRERSSDLSGLVRNLRQIGDRFFWHWDPAMLDHWNRHRAMDGLDEAATRVTAPTLLVHAAFSDVIGADEVKHFLSLVRHAAYAKVDNAGHMVAGDRNDAFNKVIIDFLIKHFDPKRGSAV